MKKGLKFAAAALLSASIFTSLVLPGYTATRSYRPYSPSYGNSQSYGTDSNYNNYNNSGYNNSGSGYNPYNYNSNYGYGNQNSYNQSYTPPLQGRVVTVPQGATISATTTSDISSEYLTVGDTVTLTLPSDFMYNGAVVLPAGSNIEGNVVLSEKAGMTGKSGRIKINFTNATTPNGQRIPMSGKIATADNSGIISGGTTMNRVGNAAKDAVLGSAAGAIVGTFMGPLSGGKVGKGAIYGTAVGGGLGLAKSFIDRGTQAAIPANSRVDIQLDRPLTVNPNATSNY